MGLSMMRVSLAACGCRVIVSIGWRELRLIMNENEIDIDKRAMFSFAGPTD